MEVTKKTHKFTDDITECRICGDEFNSPTDKEKLRCGHIFHYDCLMIVFQSSNGRKCPYCRKQHGFLRLKDGIKPCLTIHKEAIVKKSIEPVKPEITNKCQALYKSGLKAGTQCINKKKDNSEYCGIHKNLTN